MNRIPWFRPGRPFFLCINVFNCIISFHIWKFWQKPNSVLFPVGVLFRMCMCVFCCYYYNHYSYCYYHYYHYNFYNFYYYNYYLQQRRHDIWRDSSTTVRYPWLNRIMWNCIQVIVVMCTFHLGYENSFEIMNPHCLMYGREN